MFTSGGPNKRLFAAEILLHSVIAHTAITSPGQNRVIREDQRATTRLFGKRLVVRGPGRVLRIPLLHQDWRKHRIGDRGVMHDSGKVLFRGALVDAVIEGSFRSGDPVTLLRFP